MPDIRIFKDADELAARAADAAAAAIVEAVTSRRPCWLALSGGTTPRPAYERLADVYGKRIDWSQVHIFWADERYVPHDAERSNYRMARETLLDHVAIPEANVHPMPTHFADPEEAARDYEQTLRSHFTGPWPRPVVAFLGMGADGHTASLFPGSPAVQERTRWVMPVTADADPPVRLTLTPPVLSAASCVFFLVSGAGKADALAQVLDVSADPNRYPAVSVLRKDSNVIWWIDQGAASKLPARR